MKETRPFAFFGGIGAMLMGASLAFMAPVLYDYFLTGLVDRMPTWVLSMALMMMSVLLFTVGIVLDSVARSRADQLRIQYISQPGLKAKPLTLPGPSADDETSTKSDKRKSAA